MLLSRSFGFSCAILDLTTTLLVPVHALCRERERERLGEISHSRDLVLSAGFVEQEEGKEIVAVCRAGDRLHSRSKEKSSQSAALCISSTFIMTATQEEKEWIKELIGGGGVMMNLHSANTAIDILLMD